MRRSPGAINHRLRRGDYFETAFGILSERSHDELTIAALCDELGVSKGSFYHHFSGWVGFVESLLEHWERESTLNAMEIASRLEDPASRRRLIASLISTIPHDAEGAIRVWARSDPVVRAVQDRVDEERISMLTELFALHLTANQARLLAELHHAVLVSAQVLDRPVSLPRLRAHARMLAELSIARFGPEVFGDD